MSNIYGLLDTGYNPKPLNAIREDLQTAVRATFGASMDVGDRSVIGQLIGIFAEAVALVWEASEAVNSSQDPDKATGAALDAIASLTGTFRTPPSYSTTTLVWAGTTGTVIPAFSQARVGSTELVFETDAVATLAAASLWLDASSYIIGDVVVAANGSLYYCWSAASNTIPEPTHTERYDVINGSFVSTTPEAHWIWLGEGDGYITTAATATLTGPRTAVAYDTSEVVSGVSGVAGVLNIVDATEGRAQATDEELREQRELELFGAGSSPLDAIAADVAKLEGVTAVKVFQNNTDATVDGMPPHSVEVLVQGGADQDIIDQLLASVAAGIATTGNTSGTAVDSSGTAWTIQFSRPVEVPIYVAVTLTYDADEYDGDAAVRSAIAALGDGEVVGLDAVASRISKAAFVAGVLDVTQVLLDDAPAPATSTTVTIGNRQLATYSTTNVSVTSTPATP